MYGAPTISNRRGPVPNHEKSIDLLAEHLLGREITHAIERIDLFIGDGASEELTTDGLAEQKLGPKINEAIEKVDFAPGGLEVELSTLNFRFKARFTGLSLLITVFV